MNRRKYLGGELIDRPHITRDRDDPPPRFFSLRKKTSCLILLLSFLSYNAQAQSPAVTTSITGTTGGGSLGTQVLPPSGNVYGIRGGTTKGGNLFHSFSQFNVGAGDLAQFQTSNLSPNPSVGNILSRVTGGPSAIFGGIDSVTYYPNANFFFMNPAGILFGPNASVNVGGMVAFTTADYLRLDALGGPNAGIFHADPARASVLTMAPVTAFGFLGPNPAAAIEIQGSQLTLATGKELSLVGGNITIGADPETGSTSTILAPGGQINIVSVASPGEVLLPSLTTGPNINGQSFTTMGTVSLTGGSIIDVSDYGFEAGGAAGSVRIRGGQLVMDSSAMLANTLGDVDGANPGISIAVQDSVNIAHQSALITQNFAAGRSGDIEISARTVEVSGGSLIMTRSDGVGLSGQAGNISIVASESVAVTGTDEFGQPSSVMSQSVFETPESSGDSGSILLRAPSITVDQGGLVSTFESAIGRAGNITIETANLNVLTGGAISTSGGGIDSSSGNILITASNTVTVAGQLNPDTLSKITNSVDGDNAGTQGDVIVTAKQILLSDQGQIRNENFGQGGGSSGNVTLTADESITLQSDARIVTKANFTTVGGISLSAPTINVDHATIFARTVNEFQGGAITLNGSSLTISNGSQILSSTEQGTGQGGAIVLTASDSVGLSGGSVVKSTAETFSEGAAGPITVTAGNTVAISGVGTGLFSEALGAGNGGTITVAAHQVQITEGAILSAKSTGSGAAGTVTIQGTVSPAQSVLIDGLGSGIFTDTSGTGAGGNIFVNANTITLQNGGILSATTSGPEPSAHGGAITITARGVELSNTIPGITTQTTGAGNAGAISVTADEVITLTSSEITSASVFNFLGGNGGPIAITAPTVRLQDSGISTQAGGIGSEFSTSAAGSIVINATNSLSLVRGTIDSHVADTAGNAGSIEITSPSINLSNASTISSAAFNTTFNPDSSVAVGLPTDGNGGPIDLAVGQLSLSNVSTITTQTGGGGRGGNLTIHGLSGQGSSAGDINLSTGSIISTSTGDIGSAGNLTVTASRVTLTGGGRMEASTDSVGGGGNITIRATEQVSISGEELQCPDCSTGRTAASLIRAASFGEGAAGNIVINTPSLALFDGGQVVASTTGAGAGGTVTIQGTGGAGSSANSLLISGQTSEHTPSGIFTDTQGTGAGGNILVKANIVTLQNGGMLSAATSGTAPSATGGTITVDANQVQVNSGGLITASTTGAGAGGTITIGAGSTFTSNSGTVSSTAAQATGGDINITAGGSVTLDNGSLITASSNGPGNAGNIFINAGQSYASTNSSVTTKAEQASGGNITVLATGMVHLTNSEINASVEGSQTTVGGNILIDPVFVILQNSQILAQATQGTGGNINIFYTGALLVDPSSVISASSQFGQSGNVTIQSPNAPASGRIVPLGKSPLLSTSLLNQRCAALGGGNFSSFTVAGRDALPSEPGGWLSSPLALTEIQFGGALTNVGPNTPSNESSEPNLLSLRRIMPSGFLTQSFFIASSSDCQS